MPAITSAPSSSQGATRAEADAAITRGDRKLRTRAHLLAAALQLMGEGRPFGALSLREITRVAGVVPASFYRHFREFVRRKNDFDNCRTNMP